MPFDTGEAVSIQPLSLLFAFSRTLQQFKFSHFFARSLRQSIKIMIASHSCCKCGDIVQHSFPASLLFTVHPAATMDNRHFCCTCADRISNQKLTCPVRCDIFSASFHTHHLLRPSHLHPFSSSRERSQKNVHSASCTSCVDASQSNLNSPLRHFRSSTLKMASYHMLHPLSFRFVALLLITFAFLMTISGCQAAVTNNSTRTINLSSMSEVSPSVANCSRTIDQLMTTNRRLEAKLHRYRVRFQKLLRKLKRRRPLQSRANQTRPDTFRTSSIGPPLSASFSFPSSNRSSVLIKSGTSRQRILTRNSTTSGHVFVLPRDTVERSRLISERVHLLHKCSGGYVHPAAASGAVASYPPTAGAQLTMHRNSTTRLVYLYSPDQQMLCHDHFNVFTFKVNLRLEHA